MVLEEVLTFSLKVFFFFVITFGTLLFFFLISSLFGSDEKEDDASHNLKLTKYNQQLYNQHKNLLKNCDKHLKERTHKSIYGVLDKSDKTDLDHIFVIDLDTEKNKKFVKTLTEQVNFLTMTCKGGDQVVVRLNSPGGEVGEFGLALLQLMRLKHCFIPITVCIDTCACSGGFLVACVADKIYASTWSSIGSVGVYASTFNFAELMKITGVKYEEYKAGQFKNSITPFQETSEESKEHINQKMKQTHNLFKAVVKRYRPAVNIEEIGNGDVWYGEESKEKQLVDDLMISDEYLHQHLASHQIWILSNKKTQKKEQGIWKQIMGFLLDD